MSEPHRQRQWDDSRPSKYFPIAAMVIAGCNDIRVTIKFKQLNEVIMQKGTFSQESGYGPAQGSLIMDPTRLRRAWRPQSRVRQIRGLLWLEISRRQ